MRLNISEQILFLWFPKKKRHWFVLKCLFNTNMWKVLCFAFVSLDVETHHCLLVKSVGICPWFTKSILFSLTQHSTCSGSSSGVCAYVRKRTKMFLLKQHSKNKKQKTKELPTKSFGRLFQVPEWLNQDQGSHSWSYPWKILVFSCICNWTCAYPNQSQSSLVLSKWSTHTHTHTHINISTELWKLNVH